MINSSAKHRILIILLHLQLTLTDELFIIWALLLVEILYISQLNHLEWAEYPQVPWKIPAW